MTNRNQCKRFDICSAPLCPLDQGSLEHGLWYSDEEICELLDYRSLPWVKRQRKIVTRKIPNDGYFTYDMLSRNFIIGKGLRGLDADREEESQLKRWYEAHPEKRPLSDAQKRNINGLVEKGKQYHFKKKVLRAQ